MSCRDFSDGYTMLRLDAINLASTWYAEVDFGTLRVISKEWQRTFEFTPEEVILERIEQAYAKYVAQCQADCSQGASGPGYGGNNLPLRRSISLAMDPNSGFGCAKRMRTILLTAVYCEVHTVAS